MILLAAKNFAQWVILFAILIFIPADIFAKSTDKIQLPKITFPHLYDIEFKHSADAIVEQILFVNELFAKNTKNVWSKSRTKSHYAVTKNWLTHVFTGIKPRVKRLIV